MFYHVDCSFRLWSDDEFSIHLMKVSIPPLTFRSHYWMLMLFVLCFCNHFFFFFAYLQSKMSNHYSAFVTSIFVFMFIMLSICSFILCSSFPLFVIFCLCPCLCIPTYYPLQYNISLPLSLIVYFLFSFTYIFFIILLC